MTILTAASTQWATRPADQRFTSLTALHEHVSTVRERSHAKALSSRALSAVPVEGDHRALAVVGPNGGPGRRYPLGFYPTGATRGGACRVFAGVTRGDGGGLPELRLASKARQYGFRGVAVSERGPCRTAGDHRGPIMGGFGTPPLPRRCMIGLATG